jgi:hypothetical protein
MVKFQADARFVYEELEAILVEKQESYGPYNISRAPGGALNGLLVRMNDKMERIKNLYYDGGKVGTLESLEDSFVDLANYAVICLMVQRGQWPTLEHIVSVKSLPAWERELLDSQP